MKNFRSYLARLANGQIEVVFYDGQDWRYCHDETRVVNSPVAKAFPLAATFQYMEDAEWEGKIKPEELPEVV